MSDLSSLFATDPLKLTREDFEAVIAEMRKMRGNFNLGNLKAGSTKPKTEKEKQLDALASKLDLGGLDL